MSNIEGKILFLLREGEKFNTILKNEIVPKICSNQTFQSHLKRLVKEKKIERIQHSNRRVSYRLRQEYERKISESEDLFKLKNLMDIIPTKIIDDNIDMVEIKSDEKGFWQRDWFKYISLIKNYPKLRYALYLDKELSKKLKWFKNIEELSNNFKKSIREYFYEIEDETVPTYLWEDGYEYLSEWHSSKLFCETLAKAYNFQFLLYSWFDGKSYSQSILSQLKDFKKLEKNHEEDISFLDNISKRCSYAMPVYFYEQSFDEEIYKQITDTVPLKSLCKIALLYLYYDEHELLGLEAALVSEFLTNMFDDLYLEKEVNFRHKKGKIPFPLVDRWTFLEMKCNTLNEYERNYVIKKSLDKLKDDIIQWDEDIYRMFGWMDVRKNTYEKLISNMNIYYEEVDSKDYDYSNIKITEINPIFNFRYNWKGKNVNFINNTTISKFFTYINDYDKQKWLQECLDTGIPIWVAIPFNKLGFEFEQII